MRVASTKSGIAAIWVALLIWGLTPASAQSVDETQFVMRHFEKVQQISFAKKREYCGFIGRRADGSLVASEASAGDTASCALVIPPRDEMRVLSSYHTHGAFDAGYENELPSVIDVESDKDMGVNGWVATPGGRLWYIDSKKMTIQQVCGIGCLPIHYRFYKSHSGVLKKIYSFEELRRVHQE